MTEYDYGVYDSGYTDDFPCLTNPKTGGNTIRGQSQDIITPVRQFNFDNWPPKEKYVMNNDLMKFQEPRQHEASVNDANMPLHPMLPSVKRNEDNMIEKFLEGTSVHNTTRFTGPYRSREINLNKSPVNDWQTIK